MSNLETLEEIADQTTIRVNGPARSRRGTGASNIGGMTIKDNLLHTHVSREKKVEPVTIIIDVPQPPTLKVVSTATEVTNYTELMAGIQSQVEALGVRQLDFDRLAGFPQGLTGKVFGMLQVKRLGPEKLFDALRAAGLRLRLEVDPEQLAKMKARIEQKLMHPRQENQARPGHSASLPSAAVFTRVLKPVGRLGGKARWAKSSKEQRSEHMRMMAMAGVRKRRKEMKRRARQRKRAHEARKVAQIAVGAAT